MTGISAVVPAYNCAAYLPECLNSVLGQTTVPDEIIVVDDGSTDGTEELMRDHYPGVRYIRQGNAGASAARNTGIEAAQHELVAFGDADDLWHPRRLECQLDILHDRPEVDLVACRMQGFAHDGKIPNWQPAKHLELIEMSLTRRLRRGGNIALPTWLVRRDVFDRVGLLDIDLPVAEDFDIILRALARCTVILINLPLYGRRRRPDSLSMISADKYALCEYHVLSRLRPDETGDSPLTASEYWDLVPPWFTVQMLSAVSHGLWEDAREIAGEMSHAPSEFCGKATKRAKMVARIIRSVRNPVSERLITALVRGGSHLTRRLRVARLRDRVRPDRAHDPEG